MEKMHRLLQRQIKRHIGKEAALPEGWRDFLSVVNRTYLELDADREMIERFLEISSQELFQANSSLRAVIDAFPDVFLRLDRKGTVISFQRGKAGDPRLWTSDPRGRHLYDLFGSGNRHRLSTALSEVLENNTLAAVELRVDNDGSRQHYEVRLTPIGKDEIFVIVRDITERKLAEEQLIYFGMYDQLTRLYNRAYFEKEIFRFQNENLYPVGLIICDLDNLKLVNDTYGHDRGDQMLIEIGRVLRMSLRKKDILARIGGDEFAILLPGSDEHSVATTRQRIRRELARYNGGSPALPLSVSMGSAVKTDERQKMDEVFKEADDNMYKEKFIHHCRLSHNQMHTVLELEKVRDFTMRGQIDRISGSKAELRLRITRSETEIDGLDLKMHLRKETRTEEDSGWSMDINRVEFSGGKDYSTYLKSLFNLLNLALNSVPGEK